MGRAESWVTCIVGRARQSSPGKNLDRRLRNTGLRYDKPPCPSNGLKPWVLWCMCGSLVLCFWSNIIMFYVSRVTKNTFHPSCVFVYLFVYQWDLPPPNAVNPSPRMLCFSVYLLDLHSYRLFSSSVYTSFSYGLWWILIHAPPFASYDCCEGCGRD